MSDSYDDYELKMQLAEHAWEVQHHKNRAARWRAEAYKQAGHDKIELPWVGLTDDEVSEIIDREIGFNSCWGPEEAFARAVEQALKEKNT